MGLDMYAYVGVAGQREEYYNTFSSPTVQPVRDLAYWRKHGNLHGWMCNLWMSQAVGREAEEFNGVEFELSWDDIDLLERAVNGETLPETDGFFFGKADPSRHKEYDLAFCANAKAETFLGMRVFYNSSW